MALESILVQMADEEMRKIVEKCDLKLLSELEVQLTTDSIHLTIATDSPSGRMFLTYHNNEKGCELKVQSPAPQMFGPSETKKCLLASRNYVELFFQDFHIILKDLNILNQMALVLHDKDQVEFIDKLENFLKTRSPLKVHHLKLLFQKQLEIIKILKFFDSKIIQKMFIAYEESEILAPEIYNSDQWKNAKELQISDFTLENFEKCSNFSVVVGQCETISAKDLIIVKEKFLQSPTLTHLMVHPKIIDSSIYKELGPNYHMENVNEDFPDYTPKRWYYNIPGSDNVLVVIVGPIDIELRYMKKAEISSGIVVQ